MMLKTKVDPFQVKLLRTQGFTLIELLVVIIIISVLAAIALPSFLNQAGRSRAAEAMSNLATMHRSLQSYRLQFSEFPASQTSLDARVSGKFYSFSYARINANQATTSARIAGLATDLKNYDGAIVQNPGANDFFGQAICESLNIGGNPGGVIAPATPNARGQCVDPNQGRLID
jgi:type IV pilus assembly protein PilA